MTKRQLTAPDRLQQVTSGWFDWLKSHPRETAIGAGGVVVAAILIGVLLTPSSIRVDPVAGAALGEALALADLPVDATLAAEDADEAFASEEEKLEALVAAFERVRSEHGGPAALSATLSLGDVYARQGKHAEAIAAYDEILQRSRNVGQRVLALEGRAFALEAEGRLGEAAEAYARLAEEAPSFKAQALLGRGRVLANDGKHAEAIAVLEELSTDFGGSAAASEGAKRLEKLRAAAPGVGTESAADAAGD